jgi:hypothetical protein
MSASSRFADVPSRQLVEPITDKALMLNGFEALPPVARR